MLRRPFGVIGAACARIDYRVCVRVCACARARCVRVWACACAWGRKAVLKYPGGGMYGIWNAQENGYYEVRTIREIEMFGDWILRSSEYYEVRTIRSSYYSSREIYQGRILREVTSRIPRSPEPRGGGRHADRPSPEPEPRAPSPAGKRPKS